MDSHQVKPDLVVGQDGVKIPEDQPPHLTDGVDEYLKSISRELTRRGITPDTIQRLRPPDDPERRRVIVRIPERALIGWLYLQRELPDFLRLPLHNLPEGFRIIAVEHERLAQAFLLLIQHPSFALVPDGAMPPVLNDFSFREVRMALATERELAERRRVVESSGVFDTNVASIKTSSDPLEEATRRVLGPDAAHFVTPLGQKAIATDEKE